MVFLVKGVAVAEHALVESLRLDLLVVILFKDLSIGVIDEVYGQFFNAIMNNHYYDILGLDAFEALE